MNHRKQQISVYWVYATSLLFFTLFIAYSLQFHGPAYLSDEIGYLTKAAALAGRSIDHPSSWHAGYSLLLAPIFFATDHYAWAWSAVHGANALMFSCAFVVLFKILQRTFPETNELPLLAAAAIATCYPSWTVMSAYAFATPAIVLAFCLTVYASLRITEGLRFVLLTGTTAGLLYWLHPTGLAAIGGGAAALAFHSYRSNEWRYFWVYLLVVISLVVTYNAGLHPYLQRAMTAEGFETSSHYRKIGEVITSVATTEFWKTFPFMVSSQLLAALISSFGLLLVGSVYIYRQSTTCLALHDRDNRIAFILMLVSVVLALALGSLSFSLENTHRVDFWIYGRYIDPYLYPGIAIGCATLISNGRLTGPAIYTALMLVGLLLFITFLSTSNISTSNNLVNTPSFWPRVLFPENELRDWLTVGAIGVAVFLITPPTIALFLTIPLIFLSISDGAAWHNKILDDYSEKDAVVDFIRSNFEKNQCIAFDPAKKDFGKNERKDKLSFYLYKYDFKRMHISDWKTGCDGLFLTQRGIQNIPEDAIVIARSSRSGISVIARKQDASRLDYTALTGSDYFFDPTGRSACMTFPCTRLSPRALSRYTKVGALKDDRLTTQSAAGFLFHGPYVSYPKGNYEAVIFLHGALAADAFLDITSDKGEIVHAKGLITEDMLSAGVFNLKFTLEEHVDNLEVRLIVTSRTDIAVGKIEIRPVID